MAPVDKFDGDDLEWLRGLPCSEVLPRICTFAKTDPNFTPVKNGHTQRWHVNVKGRDFELLTTGPKYFDTRSKTGGGGAIDLAMHLTGLQFKQVVKMLRVLM